MSVASINDMRTTFLGSGNRFLAGGGTGAVVLERLGGPARFWVARPRAQSDGKGPPPGGRYANRACDVDGSGISRGSRHSMHLVNRSAPVKFKTRRKDGARVRKRSTLCPWGCCCRGNSNKSNSRVQHTLVADISVAAWQHHGVSISLIELFNAYNAVKRKGGCHVLVSSGQFSATGRSPDLTPPTPKSL